MGIFSSLSMVNHMKLFVDDASFIYCARSKLFLLFSVASWPRLLLSCSFQFQTKPVIRCNDAKCLNHYVNFIQRIYLNGLHVVRQMMVMDTTPLFHKKKKKIRSCRKQSEHYKINKIVAELECVRSFLKNQNQNSSRSNTCDQNKKHKEHNECNKWMPQRPNIINLNVGLVSAPTCIPWTAVSWPKINFENSRMA